MWHCAWPFAFPLPWPVVFELPLLFVFELPLPFSFPLSLPGLAEFPLSLPWLAVAFALVLAFALLDCFWLFALPVGLAFGALARGVRSGPRVACGR